MDTPFCFVAERGGRWFGVVVSRDDECVREFYTEFAGFEIKPLPTREAWLAYAEATPAFEGEEP